MGNSRKVVLRLLNKLDEQNSYSNILLDDGLKKSDLSLQDKKFASALFYGVIERRITLDRIIHDNLANPENKINPEILNILRMGIYQLKYLDSVPDSAAVDESVKLAKGNRNKAASGFVNALLRSYIRAGMPTPEIKDKIEQLSFEYSCPMWLVRKWLSEYGEEVCLGLLRTSLGQAPNSARVNTVFFPLSDTLAMLDSDGITYEINSILPDSINICLSGAVEASTAYKKGRIHIQDLSSQFCTAALDPQENDTVLDLCSAPGGKTFTIAERMNNRGNVMAFDLHNNRVKLIDFGARRLGLTCIKASVNDAKKYNDSFPLADKVLCDVPCSGLGVIRRKPEIKYKNPDEFARLPEIQYDILNTSSQYVKVGGTLVYSTCTVSRAENDDVVNKFLENNKNFETAALGESFGSDKNCTRLTFTPEKYNSDGFFIAKFKRLR